MTFSPVNRVGASVSFPKSSASAGAATPPRVNAAARAELDRISRREVLMLLLGAFEASSSLPFVAASAVLGQATREFGLSCETVEKASAEPAVKRAQSAAAVTDLRLGADILKLKNDLAKKLWATYVVRERTPLGQHQNSGI